MNLRKTVKQSKLALKVIFSAVFFCFSAYAQEITAINFNGELLGKVIPDGKVVSFDNQLLGNVTADSLIVNNKGVLIGGVVPQGVAIGNDARFLGKVGSDGGVRSASGQVIGKSLPNGMVVNEYFDIIGQIVFPGLVYNDEGKVSGRITGDGLYTNLNGQQIGIVTPDGYAYRQVGNDYLLEGRLISSKMVVSLDGSFIGSVVPGGEVTDFNSVVIGRIKANGFVYDEAGKIIGKIVSSGYAFDNNGYYLGFVSYNGEVVNENKVVGKLRADGLIVNVNGSIVGKSYDFAATATDLNGHYLGRLLPEGTLVKSTIESGLIGADGQINNASGQVIGSLIKTGPVFDYKGDLKGHALSNGSVIALNGTTIGYMVGEKAYNLSGIIIGAIMSPKAVYTQGDAFLGVSGINSALSNKGNKLSVSPFGYVFEQSGGLEGYAISFDNFYTPFGTINSYLGLNGQAVNSKGAAVGRIVDGKYVLNSQNQIIGKNINDVFAVNEKGSYIGAVNGENFLLNKSLSPIAKILPDGSVSEIKSGNLNYMPKIGQAYNKITALDFKGNFLGYADILGNINNSSGAKIGHAMERGLVSDNNGIIVGYLLGQAGAVDDKCNLLGVAASEGGVYNYRGVYVGKILENGHVVSDSGSPLGYMVPQTAVIDFNGRVIGFSSYNGKVINERGEFLGCLNKRSQLKNADNALIGHSIEIEPVIDFSGEISGYSVINGLVVDKGNNLIGYQQPNGNVNSNSGIPMGSLFKYKVAFGLDNKFMGYISNAGKVLDNENKEVGRIDFDGNVLDKDQKVGYALYDFYLYDQEGNVVGFINRNGEASSFSNQNLGGFDRGFVLNNGSVIARGNRDYLIRDKENLVIGELQLDGKVLDNLNNEIGVLSDAEKIVNANNETIAFATALQFYSFLTLKKSEDEKNLEEEKIKASDVDEKDEGRWFDKEEFLSNVKEQPATATEEEDADEPDILQDASKKYFKSLGIALTPDGEYLGDILEDDTVVNEYGDVVGYHMPDGLIIDENGNLIGTEEIADSSESEDQSGVFVPAGTFGPGGAYGIGDGPAGNLGPGGGYGPGERYDPARKAALDAAMQSRRQNISVGKISSGVRKEAFDGFQKDWSEQGIPKSISSWRVDMSEMIFSDKPIPAVISRAIDTNNPAPITAYVERNVYAEEGRNIIIPAGSRLIGSFGSITAAAEATSESARVQISWERLIRPDGSIFVFSGQTADAQGRAGALGYVDQQLFKKYTLPVVTTVLTSMASYFIASADDAAGQVENSKQQAANDARQNFLDNMESLFNEILADKTDVKAMTYIPAGTRIIIYPNTDLWLRSVERDAEESQKFQKPEVLIDDVKTGQDNAAQKREDIAKEGANSSIVYNPDDANVEAATAGNSPVLINDMAPKKSSGIIAPPPAAGTVPSSGTMPASTTTTNNEASSSDNGVPALF